MDTDEARDAGYNPMPIKPEIVVSKSFSLASLLSLFRRNKVVIPSDDLAPEVPNDIKPN